ncbi:glycosyltransferase [Patescibacteria group bacterium]|nr:glycosyltransferase [Patescibacteria group bacterium]MBU4580352.1 glycosyltransferase [Patescibacteria group bacterium]
MTLSIIIPTKNEENYLPELLKSIRMQNFPAYDYEIIVADNNSKDKTREIAKEYKCRIVKGGLPGAGRNFGAKESKGEVLLFLDADTRILTKNFLKNSIKEFKRRGLVVAVPEAYIKGKKMDELFFESWNYLVEISQYLMPYAGGWCIFALKEIHDKIKGFDEKIALGEDSDYAQRSSKKGKFRMLRSVKIQVSPRRFKKEGYLKVAFQAIGTGVYWAMLGKDKKNSFNYNFDIYNKKDDKK